MKFGLLTAICEGMTFEEVVDFAAENNLECLEVACWPAGGAKRRYAGVSHIDADKVIADNAYTQHILDYAKGKGVEISSLGYYPNTMDPDLEKRDAYVAHIHKLIDASAKLGVNMVTTFVGRDPSKNLPDNWFERHWFIGGNKGSAYIDGFGPEGKIVRTAGLLKNVGGQRTMTAAGPTRSFGPPPAGKILTEELPEVTTCHRNYFENYIRAYHGEEEFLVKIPETRRILALMEAVRKSAATGQSIAFES